MTTDLVLEIGALHTDASADEIVKHARLNGHLGVVVKGTQGTRWARANASELLSDAQMDGLQGGWLHYAEPHANEAADEAVAIMAALQTLPLGLGIWVEVDEVAAAGHASLAQWVTDLLAAIHSPRRPVALVCSPARYLSTYGLPPSTRLVLSELDESVTVVPWARRLDASLTWGEDFTVDAYDLTSVRGLVPVALGVPEAVPHGPAGRAADPEAPDEAEGTTGGTDDEEEAASSTSSPQVVDLAA